MALRLQGPVRFGSPLCYSLGGGGMSWTLCTPWYNHLLTDDKTDLLLSLL